MCVYSKFSGVSGVIICLFVDDMLIFGNDMNVVIYANYFLSSNFDMKDLGEANLILGIKIIRNNEGPTLSQSRYIYKVLKKFNHYDYDPVRTPYDSSIHLKKNSGPCRHRRKIRPKERLRSFSLFS
jgi:hypothetical protein